MFFSSPCSRPKKGSVRSHGNLEVSWTPLSRHTPIALYPQQQAAGMQMGNRGTIRRSEPKVGREEWFMKTRIVGLLALATLILAFAFIATASAAPNKANVPTAPAASALPATPAATPAERHPEIREALGALRRAKEHMEHAAHDFGGHRVEAIEATNRAIQQLELCLKFDKD